MSYFGAFMTVFVVHFVYTEYGLITSSLKIAQQFSMRQILEQRITKEPLLKSVKNPWKGWYWTKVNGNWCLYRDDTKYVRITEKKVVAAFPGEITKYEAQLIKIGES